MELEGISPAEGMRLALAEAQKAAARGEVPVGAIITRRGKIISRGHNLRETIQDPTSHAEIHVLRAAAQRLGTWRLSECTLFVTLEPCLMCAGALLQARIGQVVYGADDPKAGALRSLYNLAEDKRLNHRFPFKAGVDGERCAAILSEFFSRIRSKKT